MAATQTGRVVAFGTNDDTFAPGNMRIQLISVTGATTGVTVRFDGHAVDFTFPNGQYTYNPPLSVNSIELQDRDTAGVMNILLA